MTDVALSLAQGAADVVIRHADLLADESLSTAVLLSLFCDARAADSDVLPDGETSRRGWWADQFADDEHDQTGSKLWLLQRAKRTDNTLLLAKRYCEQALKWFIDDGVARAVTVSTSFVALRELAAHESTDYALVIVVQIDKQDGTQESFRYDYNWQQQTLVS